MRTAMPTTRWPLSVMSRDYSLLRLKRDTRRTERINTKKDHAAGRAAVLNSDTWISRKQGKRPADECRTSGLIYPAHGEIWPESFGKQIFRVRWSLGRRPKRGSANFSDLITSRPSDFYWGRPWWLRVAGVVWRAAASDVELTFDGNDSGRRRCRSVGSAGEKVNKRKDGDPLSCFHDSCHDFNDETLKRAPLDKAGEGMGIRDAGRTSTKKGSGSPTTTP
nr:hypothetical protein CFP56_36253 [Quercus suber]